MKTLKDFDVYLAAEGDAVNAPKHYTQFKIQPMIFALVNKLESWQYQIIKYILRYNEKNGLEDLKKARVWLNTQIWYMEHGEYLAPNQLECTLTRKETK